MKSKIQTLFITLVLLGGLTGGVVSFLLPKFYESNATVVVRRSQLVDPVNNDAGQRNRWVWVRDGLAVQAELVAHDFLWNLRSNAAIKDQAADEQEFVNKLRSQIKINYTGGDANQFRFSVWHSDPQAAFAICQALIERVKELYVTAKIKLYQDALKQITNQLRTTGHGKTDAFTKLNREVLEKSYEHLATASMVTELEAANLVQIIERPFAAASPSTPRRPALIVLGAMVGLSLALGSVLCGYYNPFR